jgi:hypothetical protein
VSGEVDKIIEESSVEGLNGAMILFAQKRGFSLDDPKTVRFAQCITAEFGFGKEGELYPLSKSIAEPVREALRQGRGTFLQLYAGGEEQNLRKLIRVIVSGEALNVMQDKLEEVMKFYHELK